MYLSVPERKKTGQTQDGSDVAVKLANPSGKQTTVPLAGSRNALTDGAAETGDTLLPLAGGESLRPPDARGSLLPPDEAGGLLLHVEGGIRGTTGDVRDQGWYSFYFSVICELIGFT